MSGMKKLLRDLQSMGTLGKAAADLAAHALEMESVIDQQADGLRIFTEQAFSDHEVQDVVLGMVQHMGMRGARMFCTNMVRVCAEFRSYRVTKVMRRKPRKGK